MSLSIIKEHARQHLAGKGKIDIKNPHYGASGLFEATIVVTGTKCIEYYHAYTQNGTIAMTKARTELLTPLPLFGQ